MMKGELDPSNITNIQGFARDGARFAAVKENWIQNQLTVREKEFINTEDLTVFCGTWNVNGRRPNSSISTWILNPGTPPLINQTTSTKIPSFVPSSTSLNRPSAPSPFLSNSRTRTPRGGGGGGNGGMGSDGSGGNGGRGSEGSGEDPSHLDIEIDEADLPSQIPSSSSSSSLSSSSPSPSPSSSPSSCNGPPPIPPRSPNLPILTSTPPSSPSRTPPNDYTFITPQTSSLLPPPMEKEKKNESALVGKTKTTPSTKRSISPFASRRIKVKSAKEEDHPSQSLPQPHSQTPPSPSFISSTYAFIDRSPSPLPLDIPSISSPSSRHSSPLPCTGGFGEKKEKISDIISPLPDIYAIGFQELDLRPEALLLGDTTYSVPWEEQILQTLNEVEPYVLVESKQLVGMFLVVVARKRHYRHIKNVQISIATTGIMGVMGNKGGVSIRFSLHDCSFCFINTHLNAHLANILRRNQDYHDISKRIQFNFPDGTTQTIWDHDHLFWMGDLNYRIDGLPDAQVKEAIINKEWELLLKHDQLRHQMALDRVFSGFHEGPLRFAPTYKYDNDTSIYDTSEKKRIPAWCDRVLWRSEGIQALSYSRHELLMSDHRPVSARFKTQIKNIDQEKKKMVYDHINQQLDRMESKIKPTLTLSPSEMNFGDVRGFVPVSKWVTISNVGHVVARFRFIPKSKKGNEVSERWLHVSPTAGMVVPGEQIKIKLNVCVGGTDVEEMTRKAKELCDIITLRIENGTDYFVKVKGNFLASTFGCSLSYLVRFPGALRTTSPIPQEARGLPVPKELWRMIDYLQRKGKDQVGLFVQSGVQEEMEYIRECLDTNEPFEDQKITMWSMAESLVRFLEYLPRPLIPASVAVEIGERVGETPALFKEEEFPCFKTVRDLLLDHLSCEQFNVLLYLHLYIQQLLKNSKINKSSLNKLTCVFGHVMLRDTATIQIPPHLRIEITKILLTP